MYYKLFNQVSEAIAILQSAQREGENAFVEGQDDAVLRLINQPEKENAAQKGELR